MKKAGKSFPTVIKKKPAAKKLSLVVQRELEQIIESVALLLVRLESISAQRNCGSTSCANGEIKINSVGSIEQRAQGPALLVYIFSFETCAETKPKSESTGSTGSKDGIKLSISASFRVVYSIEPNLKQLTEDEIQKFGRFIATANAWPFWRELVQSTTCRMGLPPLLLPLLTPSSLME